MPNFSQTWIKLLEDTFLRGVEARPRGLMTLEVPQRTIEVNMRKPVLTVPARRLNYRFMAAEAYWILTGDNRVETIAKYNPRIAEFSDNGETFFGAYGPRIYDQLAYVVEKLAADLDSRQAGLTIWRENPPHRTKDVPCTVAIFFSVREGLLNCHVFMRSSDIWLGIPYDVFNFSMLSHYVAAKINNRLGGVVAAPGTLYLTAASSHLYEPNFIAAQACIQAGSGSRVQPDTPEEFFTGDDHSCLAALRAIRETSPGDLLRWWEV